MHLKELFIGYMGCHGVYKLGNAVDERGKRKGVAITKRGSPTDQAWDAHLTGRGEGLGIVPLLDDNEHVMFAAIDIDEYKDSIPVDQLEREVAKLPLVMTRSKSGGAHLWMFFSEPVSAKLVIERMKELAAALGYGRSEIFPKQWKRMTDKDMGNWINLPYYGDTRRWYFEGKEHPVEDFIKYAMTKRITESTLKRLAIFEATDAGESPFAKDGPPCLHTRHMQGHAEGGRNNILYNIAVYYKKKDGNDKEGLNWKQDVIKYNHDFVNPPLATSELHNSIFHTLSNGDPTYQCNNAIISEVCNRNLCLKRLHGISDGKVGSDIGVELSNLIKIKTIPPAYTVTADGVLIELPSSESILKYSTFSKLVFENLDKQLKPVKTEVWWAIVEDLLGKMVSVDAPPEASPRGLFYIYLWNFVDRRMVDERDGIAMGNVWIEDGKAHFKPLAFLDYLKHEGFREFDSRASWKLIQAVGGVAERMRIKGKTHMVHILSIDDLEKQTQGYELPKFDAFGA